MSSERAYEFWFANQLILGIKDKYFLKSKIGSAKDIYKENTNYISKLIGEEKADKFKEYQSKYSDEKIITLWENIKISGINFTTAFDKTYPNKLLNIHSSPYALFYKGKMPSWNTISVAIIGSRRCSEYGKRVTMQLSSKLAKEGFNIISGMAMGIDGLAQRIAIESYGYSMGILGGGVDICYPKENKGLYEDLIKYGAVVSEYPVGFPPVKNNFPARNRIISGISDIVIVIEARKKSGSLITVDRALEQGKDVYVIPGRIEDILSEGCNYLIMQGADIIYNIDDFVDSLLSRYQIKSISDKNKPNTTKHDLKDKKDINIKDKNINKSVALSEDEEKVYSLFKDTAVSIEEITHITKLDVTKLQNIIMDLIIKDVIREVSKGYFIRLLR